MSLALAESGGGRSGGAAGPSRSHSQVRVEVRKNGLGVEGFATAVLQMQQCVPESCRLHTIKPCAFRVPSRLLYIGESCGVFCFLL